MSLETISTCLKDTVPGIIILGVLGTFLAALLAKLARHVLAPALGKFLKWFIWRIMYVLTKSVATQQTYLLIKKDSSKFLVYYTLQVMKLIFALFFAVLSFSVFLYGLQQPAQTLARPVVVVPLILFLLNLWWAVRALMSALLPHKLDFDELIRKSYDEFKKTHGGQGNDGQPGAS